MSLNTPAFHSRLPRLPDEYYQGTAIIHWTMTVNGRATGWLDEMFYQRLCFLQLHTLARYRLACPAYTVMPDHIHLLWAGLAPDSDQRIAIAFFRKQLNLILTPLGFQKQAFDHVLREEERKRDAFQSIAIYILQNPVRKKIVRDASKWPFSGCLIPGYPVLNVHDPEYWNLFWRIYEQLTR